jgi:lipoate-protein ligase A
MALDQALAEALPRGEGVLRFYAWDPPTISFGRNEPAAGRYDRSAAAAEGLGFVRRPTGGRAVLHDDEVTYCVVVPARALGGVRAAYRAIHEGLVAGLRSMGVPAAVADGGSVLAPDAGPCFQTPAPGEVVGGGRKLVGSAQARVGGVILQHGSVILGGDQGALTRLTGGDGGGTPPATVEDLLGRSVGRNEVVAALARAMRLALGGTWNEGDYRPTETSRADRLEEDRYARDTWTWRR